MWVNEDGQSEGLAVMVGIDVPNLRHPKGGLLPSGALSREPCNQIFNLEEVEDMSSCMPVLYYMARTNASRTRTDACTSVKWQLIALSTEDY